MEEEAQSLQLNSKLTSSRPAHLKIKNNGNSNITIEEYIYLLPKNKLQIPNKTRSCSYPGITIVFVARDCG